MAARTAMVRGSRHYVVERAERLSLEFSPVLGPREYNWGEKQNFTEQNESFVQDVPLLLKQNCDGAPELEKLDVRITGRTIPRPSFDEGTIQCQPHWLPKLMMLRPCTITRGVIGERCKNLSHLPIHRRSAEVAPRVNYSVSATEGRPQTTSRAVFSQTSSQSTTAGPGGRTSISQSPDGSQKVVARLSNVPKFLFKSDLLWHLKGSNLMADDLIFIYDAKYRLKFIQLQLPSIESFRVAQRSLSVKGRFGGRYMKMTLEEADLDDINMSLMPFRGRSLLMVKVHFGVTTEDVEHFLSGYALDASHPIKFIRSAIQAPFGSDQVAAGTGKSEFEMRVLVRFKTELEALRALREKQGAYCREKPVDLRVIE